VLHAALCFDQRPVAGMHDAIASYRRCDARDEDHRRYPRDF
jgi:hypothetical protein